ncbi:MAG: beta-ketoacyl-ACP synthase II [Candidatus Marinimicrobia bacterium]|jgi:3-oxoacyl-[acyl-carrier-protein] synthase II|nr:beta-ketoacyl-ACP synthase II [Candidatus Neomarinimicrobiota bacterium]
MKRRVVVTGMGVVSPVGVGTRLFWKSLTSGKSGIDTVTKFDTTDFPVKIGGEVKNFEKEAYIDKKLLNRLDDFTIFALVAADEAIKDAGLEDGIENMDRFGAVIGSGVGGLKTLETQIARLISRGPRTVSPFFVPMHIADIAPGHVSIRWGLKGPNYSVVSACATASNAIGDAMRLIQHGDADVIISGGTEAPITSIAYAGFANMKALSRRNDEPQKSSRPFDADRDGFVMGEGAGLIVLEEAEHAQSREAEIYGEAVGYGATADAYHITQPAPGGEGAIRAMKHAIADAGIEAKAVDYINAHGTSTQYNDKNETTAIRAVFGDHADTLTVSSTKSMTGHLLGASGGIEAIACLQTIRTGTIPPTINYETPDPDCDLNYAPNKIVTKEVNVAMSNTFGFGGHNAVLILKRWEK